MKYHLRWIEIECDRMLLTRFAFACAFFCYFSCDVDMTTTTFQKIILSIKRACNKMHALFFFFSFVAILLLLNGQLRNIDVDGVVSWFETIICGSMQFKIFYASVWLATNHSKHVQTSMSSDERHRNVWLGRKTLTCLSNYRFNGEEKKTILSKIWTIELHAIKKEP